MVVASAGLVTGEEVRRLRILVAGLELDDGDRERHKVEAIASGAHAPTVPQVEGPRGAGRRTRQVNFALGRDEHAQLAAAARSVGLRPTQLARQLVMSGVRRMRFEERRLSSE